MRVQRFEDRGVVRVTATSREEQDLLRKAIEIAAEKPQLHYNGREHDDEHHCSAILLSVGSEKRWVQRGSGAKSFEAVGGIQFRVAGDSDEDRVAVGMTRDAIYFGGSSEHMQLIDCSSEGEVSIEFSVNRCKHCGKGLITMGHCEWKTCSECAAKCKHEYVEGDVHGGYAGSIGVGLFCELCGLDKPREEGEPEMSRLEHAAAAKEKLGVVVIDSSQG